MFCRKIDNLKTIKWKRKKNKEMGKTWRNKFFLKRYKEEAVCGTTKICNHPNFIY